MYLDRCDRNPRAALALLRESSTEVFALQSVFEPKKLLECICLTEIGDEKLAEEACRSSLEVLIHELEARPHDYRLHSALGYAYALLGRKEDAVRAGAHAVELMPISKDVGVGSDLTIELTKIYAHVEERERALELIEEMLSMPTGLSVGLLRLDPVWDPLRDHPRFQEILEKYDVPSN